MLIPGFATEEGTARFRARFEELLPRHLRKTNSLWVSSIGLGTYLGEPTAACDALYSEAVTRAAELGVNVFDSAIKACARNKWASGPAPSLMALPSDSSACRQF